MANGDACMSEKLLDRLGVKQCNGHLFQVLNMNPGDDIRANEDLAQAVFRRLHDEWIEACFNAPLKRIDTPAFLQQHMAWLDVFVEQLVHARRDVLLDLVKELCLTIDGGSLLELLAGEHAMRHLGAAIKNESEGR